MVFQYRPVAMSFVSAFFVESLFLCINFGVKGSIVTVEKFSCIEHQIHKRIRTIPYSFVSVNVHAAPPLWHGIFSASAIGGKLSIASLPKQIMLPSLYSKRFVYCFRLLMYKCCAFPFWYACTTVVRISSKC